jgi:molybdate transport system ATP-binding protein
MTADLMHDPAMTLPVATSRPPAYVEAENATFRGPRGPIFADCTLTIRPGERWAILGPNGSGKGVLVAALMGKLGLLAGRLRHPFLEGDPRFADSVFGVLPPRTLALASMKEHRQWLLAREFHQHRWHGSLSWGSATVSDLLTQANVEQHNPFAVPDEAGARAFEQARRRETARFDLAPLLARPVVALSNGELHRFVLARALLRQPRLLFIDDPSAGLDEDSRRRLLEILDELDAEGMGVVLATERERDLPVGITHVLHVEAGALRGLEPRHPDRALRQYPVQVPVFSVPKLETRRLPSEIPILEVTNATVRQGDVILLDRITLRIAQGERWALVGPNGSGKSTLLSLLLADNPQVYANDVRVAGLRLGPGRSIWDQKSWLGWVSPELETYYPASARALDVVLSGFASSLGMHTSNSPAQAHLALTWLDCMGLGQQKDTPMADLTPEARRLALLARAAVHAPSLLLFDEPCQGLDSAGRSTLSAAMAATVASLSAAMIYVTHDPEEIPASVTRLLVLEHGRVKYNGPRE